MNPSDGMDPLCVAIIAALSASVGFSARHVSQLSAAIGWALKIIGSPAKPVRRRPKRSKPVKRARK